MNPQEGITLGSIQIRYYGLIIVLAMLVAAWVAARLAKRDGRDPEHVWGALTWAIIPGIIFARLFFVLFPPISLTAGCATAVTTDVCRDANWFLQNITNLQQGPLAIWSGGLNIFGAVIGGFLGAYIYIKRNKLALGPWLDIAAVALPLGQAIGRWANYINQELYGGVTNLPWGITIDSAHRVAPYGSTVNYPVATTFFHPLFLYESLWSFLAFIVLLNLFLRNRKRLFPGDIFLFYVIQYAIIRFLLEFIRVEVSVIGGINLWQAISLVVGIGALVYFLYRHRPGAAVIEAQPDLPHEPKVKATEAEQPTG
jgi:phosphatidylglycerol:prolipoprotein diacylglycerol transferase